MQKIYLATTNKGKVGEIQEILGVDLEAAKINIDEVQSMDLEYVAKKKAEEAFKQLGKPVIVDDVGIYFDAWNGFPGPFVKHLLESLDYSGVLSLLKNEKNRRVRVAAVIAYHDGKRVHTFVGKFTGTLSTEKRGTKGWGFDPIVIPDGFSETFAELGPDIKNKISHRALALKKFKKYLDSQMKQKKI